MQRPMSMNGYSWVEGNTPNMVDPSGMCFEELGVPSANCFGGGGGSFGGGRGGGGGTTSSGGFRQPGVNPLNNPIAPGSPRPSPRQSSPPSPRPNPSLQSPAGTGQTGYIPYPNATSFAYGYAPNYGGASLALAMNEGICPANQLLSNVVPFADMSPASAPQSQANPQGDRTGESNQTHDDDKPIVIDLGHGGNAAEVERILSARPNHKVIAIDLEATDNLGSSGSRVVNKFSIGEASKLR